MKTLKDFEEEIAEVSDKIADLLTENSVNYATAIRALIETVNSICADLLGQGEEHERLVYLTAFDLTNVSATIQENLLSKKYNNEKENLI